MTCAEFEREMPEFLEGGARAELQAHLKECAACSELVDDLEQIVRDAHLLQASDEPSPRVWNSIESALRKEGLIHEPRPRPNVFIPSFARRWGAAAWLVPVAASLLMGAFLYLRPHGRVEQVAQNVQAPVVAGVDLSDQQLLEEVDQNAPFMRAAYEKDLNSVNEYIRDAQSLVDANPNDAEARQSLMDAYGQKATIYKIALDRSLP